MTKVNVRLYQPIEVRTFLDTTIVLEVPGGESTLDPDEARELVKALKKHIKKAEGK